MSEKTEGTKANESLIGYILEDNGNKRKWGSLNFEEVIKTIPQGIFVIDIENDGLIIHGNTALFGLFDVENNSNEKLYLKDFIFETDLSWVFEDLKMNLYKDVEICIEFNLKNRKNETKWVKLLGNKIILENGEKLLCGVIQELNTEEELSKEIHLEKILLQKVNELTNETIFRIDLESNTIYFTGKDRNLLNGENIIGEFPKCIIDLEMVYEEDMYKLREMIECFRNGQEKEFEFRHKTADNNLSWYKVIYNFVKSKDGKPLLVVGKLMNIDEHKILEEQAKNDLLTGLLNKVTTEQSIEAICKSENNNENHGLFIIDLDNFKAVNDNLGHHFGDVVLQGVANDIKSCFRQDDIVGRIGGDEFIILMKHCNQDDIIEDKANKICKLLQKTFKGETCDYTVSASVGISVYPEHGTSFESLYKNADKALYKSKASGKNCYTKYNVDFANSKTRTVPTVKYDRNIKEKTINHEVVSTVFNLLYESTDVKLSMNAVLTYLGDYYKTDRCYIFEYSINDEVYQNSYEWVNESILDIREERQFISEEIISRFYDKNNENDVIFQTDNINSIDNEETIRILEEDKVVSCILIKSPEKSEHKLFFGMDDCQNKNVWSERASLTLYNVTKVIFSFLINYRTIQKLESQIEDFEM